MISTNLSKLVRGTRIIYGEDTKQRRFVLNSLIDLAESVGFEEIILPSIEKSEIYTNKAGTEILKQMYNFQDKGGRDLCLRPEGTSTIQLLCDEHIKQKDVKLWYFEKCFRYERPQLGRYREFWQFGCEWLNPKSLETAKYELINLACSMIQLKTKNYILDVSVKRGLSYYVNNGFEISVDSLGSQKQVCGGGEYKQGIGFALGFDRLMLIK